MQQHDPFHDLLPKPTEDDIYLMRDELEEFGRLIQRNDQVVIAGGPVIAWWGFTAAVAGLCNFLTGMHILPNLHVAPFNAAAGYIGMFVIVYLMGSAKVLKLDFQAISGAWIGACLAIPVVIIGLSFRHIDNLMVISALQSILFAIATGVSAMGSRKRWLLYPTAGWTIAALLFFFVVNDFWRPLLFSFVCLAFMTGPGIYLGLIYRRERP